MGNWTMEIDDSVAVITCTLAENDLLSFGAVSELADLVDTTSAPRAGIDSAQEEVGVQGGGIPEAVGV